MSMLVEIANTRFNNKGDALMVAALVQEMRRRIPEIRFCIPLNARKRALEAQFDFPKVISIDRAERPVRRLAKHALQQTAEALDAFWPFRPIWKGIAAASRVRAVFDVSGYSLGSHWGSDRAVTLARFHRENARMNRKIILLPKTFGPFASRHCAIARCSKQIVASAALAFCRDRLSYQNLEKIGASAAHVRVFPDYTATVEGIAPARPDLFAHRAVIVPNIRMIDKTDPVVGERYIGFLKDVFRAFDRRGHHPFILLHEPAADRPIVPALEAAVGRHLEVVVMEDPLRVKGLIGSCYAVVSSRLHGIINALAQGIPVIGTRWSHKYDMLFMDYDCPELLVTDIRDAELIDQTVQQVCDEDLRAGIAERLRAARQRLVTRNHEMWDAVAACLSDSEAAPAATD